MAVVKVKAHYQVTIPPKIRTKAGVAVGDLFEAKVEGRTITLVPKRLIRRELTLALGEGKHPLLSKTISTAVLRASSQLQQAVGFPSARTSGILW